MTSSHATPALPAPYGTGASPRGNRQHDQLMAHVRAAAIDEAGTDDPDAREGWSMQWVYPQ